MVDVAANTTTTARFEIALEGLIVGGSYSGLFETNGDKDWIAVTLNAGTTYKIYGSGTANGSTDTFMSLYNAGSALVSTNDDDGAGLNPYILFTPGATSTYYVEMKMLSAANFPGEYSVWISASNNLNVFLNTAADNYTAVNGNARVMGGAGDDTIRLGTIASNTGFDAMGEQGNDILHGNSNINYMSGGIGDDQIFGYADNDRMFGDAGNDTMNGGAGADIMIGGTGNDTYFVDNVGDAIGETLLGGTDLVYTALNNYVLATEVENLKLEGGSIALNASGNELANEITGNLGANTIHGGGGNDILIGGLGADILYGDAGKDTTTGGGGLDRMVITSLTESGITFATRDVINTFSHGDKIDLSAIDANANVAGNQAFTFVSDFTGVAGQLQWDITGISNTGVKGYLVTGDVNGDSAADFSLQIYTSPTANLPGGTIGWNLAAFDFIL